MKIKRRVLITGDAGMLGNAIKKELLKDTLNYHVLDSEIAHLRNYTNQFHFLNGKQIKESEIDITSDNLQKCAEFLSENDIVINCAAYVNTDKCESFSYEAVMSNVIGTQKVIELCKKTNCYLINFSTTAVFDPEDYMLKGNGVFSERAKINPKTIYGATKYASELAVKQSYSKQITIKPVFIYGDFPYDNSSNIVKIFKHIIFEDKGKLEITLSKNYLKNYFYVDYFSQMMKQIIDNVSKCTRKDFILSRGPFYGKEFIHYLSVIEVVLKSHNILCLFDSIFNYIQLSPEKDYLKNHLGYSKMFNAYFKDFQIDGDFTNDYLNIEKSFLSIKNI